jgi:hypothetical protein
VEGEGGGIVAAAGNVVPKILLQRESGRGIGCSAVEVPGEGGNLRSGKSPTDLVDF